MAQRPKGAGTNRGAPFGALELTVTRTPPLRTGLLSTGPSDLDVRMNQYLAGSFSQEYELN